MRNSNKNTHTENHKRFHIDACFIVYDGFGL